jgi:hypothetical protein
LETAARYLIAFAFNVCVSAEPLSLQLNLEKRGRVMKKAAILIAHSFIGWAFCATIMGIGPQLIGMRTTLIFHLILGPIGFGLLSVFYHKRFGYTSPIGTAAVFLLFVAAMDFFLVGLIILGNLEMFTSVIGIWLPFALIFLFSFGGGLWVRKKGLSEGLRGRC